MHSHCICMVWCTEYYGGMLGQFYNENLDIEAELGSSSSTVHPYLICLYLLWTEKYNNLYLINWYPCAEPHCEVARIHPLAGIVIIPNLHFPQFNYHACRLVGTVHSPTTPPYLTHPNCDSGLNNWHTQQSSLSPPQLNPAPLMLWATNLISHQLHSKSNQRQWFNDL